MKIKKILSVILVLSLVMLTFYGCKSDSTQDTASAINDSADTEITEAQETTAAVSSSDFYSDEPFDEGNVEDDGEVKTGTYTNPKTYSDASVTVNGVSIALPVTLSEFAEKTGFQVDSPDEQLQASSSTDLDAKSNNELIEVHINNFDASPKAYKDCQITTITAYQNEVKDVSLSCGLSLGQKANLNGIINSLGNPAYYSYSYSAEYGTIGYNLDNGGSLSITLNNNSVEAIIIVV
ncbi:MAG: hypothetical protein ACI4IE_02435 [Eubacterium sp.]